MRTTPAPSILARPALTLTLILAGLTLPGSARAYEPGYAPVLTPTLPGASGQLGYVPCGGGMECLIDTQAFKLALKADPDYGAATGKLVAGVVVTALGGVAALILGFVALINAAVEEDCRDYPHGCGDNSTPASSKFAIGSVVSLGVGLAVGLPLLISGASGRTAIRQRIMQQQRASQAGFGLIGGPGQAGLGVRYTF